MTEPRICCDHVICNQIVADLRARLAAAEATALAAIKNVPRRSGTPEWDKAASVAQAAGFDVGLATASDAVASAFARAALAASPTPTTDGCSHAPTFDEGLRCPTCMQVIRDRSPEVDAVMRSIEEYRNAPSGTASVPRSASPTPTGPEPATCEHKRTQAHQMLDEFCEWTADCPGPATPTGPELEQDIDDDAMRAAIGLGPATPEPTEETP